MSLKTCPFCANEAKVTYTGSGAKRKYYVICIGCLARTRELKTEHEAIIAWDVRLK